MQTKPVYLVLENGTVFCGKSFGYEAETVGETVFTTGGMAGYMSTLTDQGYAGQIVVQTFPLIGNYGVVSHECESKGTSLKAYVVRELCQEPSNFRCEGALDVFLSENKIVGVSGIDTRKLTRILRDNGSMRAKITYTLPSDIEAVKSELKSYRSENPIPAVTCKEACVDTPEGASRKIVLMDLGALDSIKSSLMARGCEVITVPAYTKSEDILSYKPDGVVISNGPGCACHIPEIVSEVTKLFQADVPMLGICLGHLVLAAANGAKCIPLPHGHRGSMPSIRLTDNRVFIASQNQGYTLDESTLGDNIEVAYRNGNDGSVEGVVYKNAKALGVQFRPGSTGGPNATDFIYDEFLALTK